ncbi:gustatory and odorant receptor 24-like [Cryptotermes secundus]|uniref:gustatory and odorant receptor 24-like n=1 Tax=Cryptotermes secundus TaxID=105785 RepID=UPI000CD7DE9E|nr:gustatory and odorant receptor 24-like [Cryptotermes secundus]XP_033608755.1 gustatory and odorant receptor 24-like [Cryptotermes secundus]
MSAFPGSDTRLNTTNILIREVAPVSMFSDNQQLVKTNPSNETPQNKFTGVKDTLNSFNRELNPIIKVLQVSGIIPITKTPRGMWVFSPLSPLMIYSVCLYFTMLVILWFTTGVRLQELMATHRHFNVMFFVFMAVSYFLIILAIPVINWPEANNIARYLSSWARFQEKYSKMTGRPLSLGLRRKVFIIMCVLPVLIFSFEVIYQLTNGDDVWVDWWVAVKEWYLDVVRFYVVTFWHLTCGALSSAAGSLWRNFRKECEESPRRVLQIIDTHRELWVQLSRLVRQTGCAMTYTYGFYILYMFLSLTFFVYHTMSNLARQLRADQVLMAIECCVMEYTLYLICNAANNASRDVGDEIRDGLLEARWSCNDKAVQKEFDKFLKTMDIFPPVVSLGDFTVINRTLFISLGTMMTTYLIVLLQFNMSSSDSQGYNITLQI